MREVWPEDLPVFFRISATDWLTEGGWDARADRRRWRAGWPAAASTCVDCSTGGIAADAKIAVGPGYQVPFAARVRRQAGIATGAVGIITEPQQAEDIIATGQADAVSSAANCSATPTGRCTPPHALGRTGVPRGRRSTCAPSERSGRLSDRRGLRYGPGGAP